MSKFDYENYADTVREFRFHLLSAGFATNSIKLVRRYTSGRGVPYIWIDPPWVLWHDHRPYLASSSYPDPSRPGGPRLEKLWLRKAGAFGHRHFLSLTLHDGVAVFRFSDKWTIQASGWQTERDPDLDYDDWYARGRHDYP